MERFLLRLFKSLKMCLKCRGSDTAADSVLLSFLPSLPVTRKVLMRMFASGFLFKSLHLVLIREARGPQPFFWARRFIGTALICCKWHSLGGIPLLSKDITHLRSAS